MNEPARKIQWLAWGGLTLVIATILLAFVVTQFKLRTLTAKPLPVYGQVADFILTNQTSRAWSRLKDNPLAVASSRSRRFIKCKVQEQLQEAYQPPGVEREATAPFWLVRMKSATCP